MIIVQILIREKVLDLGTLFEVDNTKKLLLLYSLIASILNVVFALTTILIASKEFDEGPLDYILNSFKARQ